MLNAKVVIEATNAIKKAWDAVNESIHPVAIDISRNKIKVHLNSYQDLKQVPGREIMEILENEEFPMLAARLAKTFQEVEFFCFLNESELEEHSRAVVEGVLAEVASGR